MIQVIQLLVASGTIAALHLGLLLEPLIRIHAKNERVEGIDFEAAKNQIMSDPRVEDLVQNVEAGMGVDPSTIDAGPYGDFTDGDGDYPMEYQGKKVPGEDYEIGTPPDPSDYDVGFSQAETMDDLDFDEINRYRDDVEAYPGGDIDSDYLQEARRLRRRRLRRRR